MKPTNFIIATDRAPDLVRGRSGTPIAGVGTIFGSPISAAPGSNQVLVYNSTTDAWDPVSIFSLGSALQTIGASGTAQTLNLALYTVFDVTLTANCTFTFINPAAAGTIEAFTVILRQGGSGSYTATWPASVLWQNTTDGTNTGAAPTLWTAVGAQDDILFNSLDGGTTYGGFHTSAAGVTFAAPALTLGTANAAGSAASTIRSDAAIALFDATVPLASSGAGSNGTTALASRSDHYHPAGPGSGGLLIADGHSSPLVFDDILQSDAGDDFLYADL